MSPAARLVHHMHGRARLRVPQRRGDAAWFEQLKRQLVTCEGVRSVDVNAKTASVLILHTVDVDRLLGWADQHGLFTVDATTLAATPASSYFAERLTAVDRRVHQMSGGLVDGRAVAFAGLMAAAAWQLLRGNVWPAAGSLAWYAFSTLPPAEGRRTARRNAGPVR